MGLHLSAGRHHSVTRLNAVIDVKCDLCRRLSVTCATTRLIDTLGAWAAGGLGCAGLGLHGAWAARGCRGLGLHGAARGWLHGVGLQGAWAAGVFVNYRTHSQLMELCLCSSLAVSFSLCHYVCLSPCFCIKPITLMRR